MAGLDPAIYVLATEKKGVDARVKPGHDESVESHSLARVSKDAPQAIYFP
jgi:hypothetical protein